MSVLKKPRVRYTGDVKVLRDATRALMRSSNMRMLRATLDYLQDRFLAHPSPDVLKKFYRRP